MKITYVANSVEIGGGNKSLLTLAREMLVLGHDVEVILPRSGLIEKELIASSIPYNILTFSQPELRSPIRTLTGQLSFLNYLFKFSPDVVHVNDYRLARAVSIATRICGIPLISHVRFGTDEHTFSWLWRKIPKPNSFIFNSCSMYDRHKVMFRSVCPNATLHTIYNPIDVDHFSFLDRSRVSTHEPTIGMVGNLSRVKGQDILLRAVALLARRGNYFLVRFAGYDVTGSTYGKSLERLAAELGISEQVIFEGHIQDIEGFLHGVHVCVCPSREEPFGRSAAEALACGIPVVASNVGGLPEVVVNNECGLLVPPDDPEALADAIWKEFEDVDMCTRFAISGRRRVEQLFSKEAHTHSVLEVYNKLTNDRTK